MKKYILLTIILLGSLCVEAQDPHFSQNDQNAMYVNPGNTALKNDIRASVSYRNQWRSIATPYQTIKAAFDMKLSKQKSPNAYLGLGVQILNDRAGDADLSLTQGNLNISGVLKINNENKFSLGLMGGFGQRSVDYSSLRWESQYDGAYNPALSSNENILNTSFTYFDAGAGLVWHYGTNESYITANDGIKVTLGVSAFHFGVPKTSFDENNQMGLWTKLSAFGRAELGQSNSNFTIIPEFYFSKQGVYNELVFGSQWRYLFQEGSHFTGLRKSSSMSLHTHYRLNDAFIAGISFDYANYKIGFSYDFNVSKLSPWSNSRGAFELNLLFVTPNPYSASSRSRI